MKDVHRLVLQLREKETPIKQIAKEVGLSKSTVSYILSKHFPKNRHEEIRAKNSRALHRSPGKARNLAAMRVAAAAYYTGLRSSAKKKWSELLRNYTDTHFIHYIAGLYDGEGRHNSRYFDLSNSNPSIIREFLRFVREVLLLPEEGFRVSLYLHTSLSKEGCVSFWEGITEHPMDGVYQTDSRSQRKVHRHNLHHQYKGTVCIRVRSPMGLAYALKEYSYAH
jgi:DNA-binding Lrp family transcriptional regulator